MTDDPREPAINPGDEGPEGTPGTGEDLCPVCGGSGETNDGDCPNCPGTGIVQQGIGGG